MIKKNLAPVFICLLIGAASCKKCYTCAVLGQSTSEVYCSKDYTATQMNAFDSSCVHNGGVWSLANQ